MNEEIKSKTQLIVSLCSDIRAEVNKRFDKQDVCLNEIQNKVHSIPVIQVQVNRHEEDIKDHKQDIKGLSSDVNKAKGWAAATGAISGFFSSMFHK